MRALFFDYLTKVSLLNIRDQHAKFYMGDLHLLINLVWVTCSEIHALRSLADFLCEADI
jgi:hypothetical protein